MRRWLTYLGFCATWPLLVLAGDSLGQAPAGEVPADHASPPVRRATPPFTDGEAAFHTIFTKLQQHYANRGLTGDDLYRAAAKGLLEALEPGKSANRLFTPAEYRAARENNSGSITGIGVVLKFEAASGMGLIIQVLPGSSAQAAGLLVGDRILRIDGRGFNGKTIDDLTQAVRGKVGTDVAITLLRDATVFGRTLRRRPLNIALVETQPLGDGEVLLDVNGIATASATQMAAAIQKSVDATTTGLVLDLRNCQGGDYQAGMAVAGLLLPPGTTVAKVVDRDGNEHDELAAGGQLAAGLPLVVLIDGETAGICEVVAAALQHERGATLVGQQTFGKWSTEAMEELPNHYAMVYAVGRFLPLDGSAPSDKGLTPDVPVANSPTPRTQPPEALTLAERLAMDPPLQAAQRLLKGMH